MTRTMLNKKAKKLSGIASTLRGYGYVLVAIGIMLLKTAYPESMPGVFESILVFLPAIVIEVATFIIGEVADKTFEKACDYPG